MMGFSGKGFTRIKGFSTCYSTSNVISSSRSLPSTNSTDGNEASMRDGEVVKGFVVATSSRSLQGTSTRQEQQHAGGSMYERFRQLHRRLSSTVIIQQSQPKRLSIDQPTTDDDAEEKSEEPFAEFLRESFSIFDDDDSVATATPDKSKERPHRRQDDEEEKAERPYFQQDDEEEKEEEEENEFQLTRSFSSQSILVMNDETNAQHSLRRAVDTFIKRFSRCTLAHLVMAPFSSCPERRLAMSCVNEKMMDIEPVSESFLRMKRILGLKGEDVQVWHTTVDGLVREVDHRTAVALLDLMWHNHDLFVVVDASLVQRRRIVSARKNVELRMKMEDQMRSNNKKRERKGRRERAHV